MRKTTIISLLLLLSVSTQAQSLSDLFKALTGSSSTTTTTTTEESNTVPSFSRDAILGGWSFTELAVGLSESSPLKGAFGNVAISQVESMLNSMCASNGFSEGMFTLTFFSNSIASVAFEDGTTAKTPYVLDVEQETITVNIEKINDTEVGELTATVSLDSDSMTLLFVAKELMAIADKIPSITENSQYQMAKSVVNSVDGVMLGFKLSKKI